jgi:predicted MFS family arabinose efflux permease
LAIKGAESSWWCAAFMMLGLPGLLLAFIVWRTVTDPERGATDAADTPPDPATTTGKALQSLWRVTSMRYLWGASCFHFIVTFAILTWSAAYLIRIHESPADEVGLWFGLVLDGGFAIGNLCGGYTADVLARRSVAWYFLMPATADLIALPFYLLFLLAPI